MRQKKDERNASTFICKYYVEKGAWQSQQRDGIIAVSFYPFIFKGMMLRIL